MANEDNNNQLFVGFPFLVLSGKTHVNICLGNLSVLICNTWSFHFNYSFKLNY